MVQYENSTASAAEMKSVRKELRMKPDVAAKIKNAALMAGLDESNFITSAAYQKAQELEQAQFVWVLPQEQFDAFAAAVDGEGESNAALVKLMKQSREIFIDP